MIAGTTISRTDVRETPERGRPPCVSRGAQPQRGCDSPYSVGIDWLRVVHSVDMERAAIGWCVEKFGDEVETLPGVHRYRERWRWPNGAEVWVRHATAGGCAIELGGSVLAQADGATRTQWLVELRELGFRPTRIDLAIDIKGRPGEVRLVEDVAEACDRDELCRFRRWRPVRDFVQRHLVGQGVYLGRRGDSGGGKMVRVYDKGLEQNEARKGRYKPNQWHRWEVELADEHAVAAFDLIATAENELEACAKIALGVADFREVTGRRELDRRPRLAWWSSLIERMGGSLRYRVRDRSRHIDACVRWMRRCVMPLIAGLAEDAQTTPEDVIRKISSGVDPGGNKQIRDDWRRVIGGQFWADQSEKLQRVEDEFWANIWEIAYGDGFGAVPG